MRSSGMTTSVMSSERTNAASPQPFAPRHAVYAEYMPNSTKMITGGCATARTSGSSAQRRLEPAGAVVARGPGQQGFRESDRDGRGEGAEQQARDDVFQMVDVRGDT